MKIGGLNITGLNFFETNNEKINKVKTEKIPDEGKNFAKEIKNFGGKILNTFLGIENKTQKNLLNKNTFEDKIKQESEDKIKKELKKEEEEKNYYLNLSQEEKGKITNGDNLIEKVKLASAGMENLEGFQ